MPALCACRRVRIDPVWLSYEMPHVWDLAASWAGRGAIYRLTTAACSRRRKSQQRQLGAVLTWPPSIMNSSRCACRVMCQ